MLLTVLIGTHNEGEYIPSLLQRLVQYRQTSSFEFQIIVVDDFSTDAHVLAAFSQYANDVTIVSRAVNGDYGTHKSFMNSLVTTPWILNLDADEYVTFEFFDAIPQLIDLNPLVDAYALPRVNIVTGLPLSYLQQWRVPIHSMPEIVTMYPKPIDPDVKALWTTHRLIERETDTMVTIREPLVAWPDYQFRLYKADPAIRWNFKVHEQLVGYQQGTPLPADTDYAIWHRKTFKRQSDQNQRYATMER